MIKEFQKLLTEKKIDYYIVPTDDDHQSENVGDYFQSRAYLSGFTGSAELYSYNLMLHTYGLMVVILFKLLINWKMVSHL